MSKIVIYLDEQACRAEALLRIQKVTKKSLSEIRSSLVNGNPIVEIVLFKGDYDSHAFMLRSFLSLVDEMSLQARIYELPEGANPTNGAYSEDLEITPVILKNILSAADREIDRQLGE
ncbi:hypothetical protein [Rubinisphaera margarita]|uniref:hypothetical protein n=1 Tax=Rubinisphaera margarita TaxID=2909586 RepID=UPI001EE95C65|nr:hypothetical protein [Rubinisphaera margarita]MCG6157757.1 hypothetical protein [Rubinisphaera margarita]